MLGFNLNEFVILDDLMGFFRGELTFDVVFIMSNVSLERYYFVLYDGALTLKMSKMALNAFCDKTLHLF